MSMEVLINVTRRLNLCVMILSEVLNVCNKIIVKIWVKWNGDLTTWGRNLCHTRP